MPFQSEVLEYDASLESEWKEGSLAGRWFQQYPNLFEINKDLEHNIGSQHRHGYHFAECYGAIHYHKQLYEVLIETYMEGGRMKLSDRKQDVLRHVVGDDRFRALQNLASKRGIGFPDLFVYKDRSDYFFCDVKKKTDRKREEQRRLFERLSEELQCRVVILKLKPKASPRTLPGPDNQS